MSSNPGPLLLIGGAEDKVGGRVILSRFVQLAGGDAARIVVVATASAFQDLVGQRYVALFTALGAPHVEMLRVHDRTHAQQDEPLVQLAGASGIFLTGGDQLKLTAVLGGTRAAEMIRQRHRAGVAVGGTSAGASAAAEHMMAYGASGIPPRKAMMHFGPGLGLVRGVVVDQHFGARGRAGRLMTAVAHNPELLGIGLDEDTAVEIDAAGWLTVLGHGSVIIVDGAGMTYTDIHNVPDQAPLTIFDMRVHVLSSGYCYDIPTRAPHLPTEHPPPPETGYVGGEGI
ncbi:MAG TPA: cyanophycinase [Roseiflexaceae bacterium]|nr:cyanophycinase [Roseiflexaceae bacterium]